MCFSNWCDIQHSYVNNHQPPHDLMQVNRFSAALEDMNDENGLLRRKAGLPADQHLDVTGLKMQKEITIAQLRSVNALLERQVRKRHLGVLLSRCVEESIAYYIWGSIVLPFIVKIHIHCLQQRTHI